MRTIHAPKGRSQLRYRRHIRVRQRVSGTAERPRLVVFRSLKHIYAQLVNDDLGVTLLGVGDSTEPAQDTWITTKVKTNIATLKDIDATDISVETNNGVVSLTCPESNPSSCSSNPAGWSNPTDPKRIPLDSAGTGCNTNGNNCAKVWIGVVTAFAPPTVKSGIYNIHSEGIGGHMATPASSTVKP